MYFVIYGASFRDRTLDRIDNTSKLGAPSIASQWVGCWAPKFIDVA